MTQWKPETHLCECQKSTGTRPHLLRYSITFLAPLKTKILFLFTDTAGPFRAHAGVGYTISTLTVKQTSGKFVTIVHITIYEIHKIRSLPCILYISQTIPVWNSLQQRQIACSNKTNKNDLFHVHFMLHFSTNHFYVIVKSNLNAVCLTLSFVACSHSATCAYLSFKIKISR